MKQLLDGLQSGVVEAGLLLATVIVAVAAHGVLYAGAARVARRSEGPIDQSLVRHSKRPTRWIFPILALFLALPFLRLAPPLLAGLRHALALGLIAAVAWLIVAMLGVLGDIVAARYPMDVRDNLQARRIRTQLQLLRRTTAIVVGTVAVSIMLMTFPGIRHLGASLLASAGLAGLVVGMAARPTLSNLIAGLQIALTEPIRLDDVVIAEGEWGRIEEIGSTYVVVRIWDLRRLVLPLSYFIEQPFQNWTRVSADLLGTTLVYADYSVPVEEVRGELHRILQASGMWDGKTWSLQVTNASEHTVELRALMSAPDSGQAWNLRCHVREKLIEFLRQRHPHCLPRLRAEVGEASAASS